MSKNRGRDTVSSIARREVINERCEGCGKPGQWPLHSDGHSRLCPDCGPSFALATSVAEAAKRAMTSVGGPVTPQGQEYVVGEQPACAGILPVDVVRKLEGVVQKPEFNDIELAAISFVLDNINSPVPPGLMEHLRSVKQKLMQYAREKS